jgi:catechol 2,3-dioxygenase-like lactoylglutathione lyase family enzyme
MSVLGIDEVTYGVEDLDSCVRFFADWGLSKVSEQPDQVIFETLNGCRVVLAAIDKPGLPPAIEPGSTVREVGRGQPGRSAAVQPAYCQRPRLCRR